MDSLYTVATTPQFNVTPYQLLWCILNPLIVAGLLRVWSLAPSRGAAWTVALTTAVAVLFWNWSIAFNQSTRFLNIDAPVVFFPISWADFFDGVMVTAANALVLGFGVARKEPAFAAVRMAGLAGLVVLLTDVYLF